MSDDRTQVFLAVARAVRHAIETVGVEGVRSMSMFPSADRAAERQPLRKAA